MANFVYNVGKTGIFNGTIDMVNDTINVLLVNSSYVANKDHDFVNDVTGGEITATNYVRKTLTGGAITIDNANDRSDLDYADVSWTALGGAANDTIDALVVFKQVTNDADSIPIIYIDTSTGSPSLPYTTNGGDLTININDILRLVDPA